jgi:hypothetical protein
MKRYLIGFGAGATVIQANVKLEDAVSGRVICERRVKGITWSRISGGSSDSVGDHFARRLMRYVSLSKVMASR